MVLVANHPIGSLDGPVLLRAVAAVRPDVKVVASQLLTYIEPLRNLFVPVDNVAYKTSRKQIEGMQQQLDNQGALILFPAGEVSRMSPKGIRDGHWHTGFLRPPPRRARRSCRSTSARATATCSTLLR